MVAAQEKYIVEPSVYVTVPGTDELSRMRITVTYDEPTATPQPQQSSSLTLRPFEGVILTSG